MLFWLLIFTTLFKDLPTSGNCPGWDPNFFLFSVNCRTDLSYPRGHSSQYQEDILPYVEGYPFDIGNDEESSPFISHRGWIPDKDPHMEDGGLPSLMKRSYLIWGSIFQYEEICSSNYEDNRSSYVLSFERDCILKKEDTISHIWEYCASACIWYSALRGRG